MEFNGFRSISEYERECSRSGFTTVRIPFRKGEESFFVLLTGLSTPSPTSAVSWNLFSSDEKVHVMEGVLKSGEDRYLKELAEKLAALGYHQETTF